MWRRKKESDAVWSVRELRAEYDRRAQKLLGISGKEFAARARSGDLPDTPAVDHLKLLLGAVTKSQE